jgi:hypothetical protein
MKTKARLRGVWQGLGGVLAATLLFWALQMGYARAGQPDAEAGPMPSLTLNRELVTVNTTRIGSDDPVETAAAVAQIIYPATEEEDTPGAVILVNPTSLAEVMVAANRMQHFPVNAPLLYAAPAGLPELTRRELLRLAPEGVPMDGNVQVYLVGSIGAAVETEVRGLGFKTRRIQGADPIALAVAADSWSSTQHGDHPNEVAIANLDHLEPAIPVAFWNAHMGQGFAFVTDDGVPEATKELLRRRAHGAWIYVFGDESVISAATAAELAQFGQVTRIPRADPAAASAYFAGFKDLGADWGAWFWQGSRDFGWGISEAGHNAIFVALDGPGGWQNALPATTLSHMGKHAPVLILNGGGVPEAVADYLAVLKPYPSAPRQQLLNHGWIIGGENTISWETQVALDGMLEAYPWGGGE